MRRSRRRRSTSSCVSPGPRVPMPAPCWLSCGAAAAQARQPVAQLRELDLHRAFLARRVLGEDVEDQRDAVDDVDREQLLEVALLRGRELVVEDHDVDVERVRRLARARRPCPCRCRSRGRASARRCSSRCTGSAPAVSASERELVERARRSSCPTEQGARWRTRLRSTSVAVSRRRCRLVCPRGSPSRGPRRRRRTRARPGRRAGRSRRA